MDDLQKRLENAVASIRSDSEKLHEIVHGDDNTVVTTEKGLVKSAAKAIADIVAVSNQMLSDFSNAPDNSMKLLGFAGFSKNSGAHIPLEFSRLDEIDVNSIYTFNNATDAPFTGKGIVHTLIHDRNFALQIVYAIYTTSVSDSYNTAQFIRSKSSGRWGDWSNTIKMNSAIEAAIDMANLLYSKGDIVYHDGAKNARLGKGNDGQVLTTKNGSILWETQQYRYGSRVADIPTTKYGSSAYRSGGVIMNDGTLRVWGRPSSHQLGQGWSPIHAQNFPIQPAFPNIEAMPIKWIRQSYENLVLFDNGEVWSWGENIMGALGRGHALPIRYPERILALDGVNIVDIQIGTCRHHSDHHTLFLADDGRVWACGCNNYGQLGLGDTHSRSEPVLLAKKNWDKIYAVGSRYGRSFGIDKKGDLYAWGYNSNGALGVGDVIERLSPTHVNAFGGTKVVDFSGSMNDSHHSLITVFGHSLCRLSNGGVYSWGYNEFGQLGLGNNNTQYTVPQPVLTLGYDNEQILAADGYYGQSFVVKSDGRVLACGHNRHGALGQGNALNYNYFSEMSNSKRIGRRIVQIQPVGSYMYSGIAILYDDGIVRVAGYNKRGNLGLGHAANTDTLNEIVRIMKHKVIKLCVVGTAEEACLGFLTEEGLYYQTGFAEDCQRAFSNNDIVYTPQLLIV